jgi:hypothetical protein
VNLVISTANPKRSFPNPKPLKRGVYIDENNGGFGGSVPLMMHSNTPRGELLILLILLLLLLLLLLLNY